MDSLKPLVSVWCIAYNHEAYIKDAIEGFLLQKTTFPIEIVIHDDASTDNTANIIRQYEEKFPDRIRGIYQTENQMSKQFGQMGGRKPIMERELQGKYIALCEGDDCWIDCQKLQIQIEYMEAHPECVLTMHSGIWLDCRDTSVRPILVSDVECDLPADTLIMQYNGHPSTASCVYRREMLEIDDFFLEAGAGDYTMQLYCMTRGKVHYFNRCMSVYRFMATNSHTERCNKEINFRMRHYISMIEFLIKYDKYTEGSNRKYIFSKIQVFVNCILNDCENIDYEQFEQICKDFDKKYLFKYTCLLQELKRLFLQRYQLDYLDENTLLFIKKYPRLFIWGAGKYGKIIGEQLRQNGIEFEGFLISDNQASGSECLGKPVFVLKDVELDAKGVGIIIGIGSGVFWQIDEIIAENNITNYISPFWLKIL